MYPQVHRFPRCIMSVAAACARARRLSCIAPRAHLPCLLGDRVSRRCRRGKQQRRQNSPRLGSGGLASWLFVVFVCALIRTSAHVIMCLIFLCAPRVCQLAQAQTWTWAGANRPGSHCTLITPAIISLTNTEAISLTANARSLFFMTS
jgi:hypothetical protein